MSRVWYKINLLSGAQFVWIQSFPSPRLVDLPRLNVPVCPPICPYLVILIRGCVNFKDISEISLISPTRQVLFQCNIRVFFIGKCYWPLEHRLEKYEDLSEECNGDIAENINYVSYLREMLVFFITNLIFACLSNLRMSTLEKDKTCRDLNIW